MHFAIIVIVINYIDAYYEKHEHKQLVKKILPSSSKNLR